MALKPDRRELDTDISFFMDQVSERGVIVVYNTSGSGSSMDDGNNTVVVADDASGNTPVGLLLNDVVDKDLTRTHINFHKDEMQKGGKVTILRKGFVVTDKVTGTPTGGDSAWLAASGMVSPTQGNGALVGEFGGAKDEDGFVKLFINLP